ncbi:MAG: DUF87 domain-containing protein [Lentilitoribacter sp.]
MGDFDRLGQRLGLHLVEFEKPEFSLASLINRESEFNFKPMTGKLFAGEMRFRDIPAELLHKLALQRNGELFELAKDLAKTLSSLDDDTRKHLSNTLAKDMAAPMPSSWLREYHREVFPATELEKASTPSYRYTPESRILAYWVPTLIIYKFITDKIALKDYRSSAETARDYILWKDFVLSSQAPFSRFFSKALSAYIDFGAFKEHGYVLGATKAGKTELLKTIVHHIIAYEMPKNPKIGGILIDPHGDFSREVALYNECSNNDRVVVFDPTLYRDWSPSIDIFYTPDQDEKTIEVIAENLVTAFDEIIADTSVSANMKALLMPCISVLLRCKGSSIMDLQRFMMPETSQDLVELGKQSPIHGQAAFFKNGFEQKKYDPTKSAIYTRLQILQNSQIFNRLVNPKGRINIERELNDGKFIIMNLSRGAMSESVSSAFGRLVLAAVKSTGYRRESIPLKDRPESYIFVDECQNYISESIEVTLTELRKYGVHLVLANQVLGQNMSTQLVKIILGNTGVKITGKNGQATNAAMAKELGIDIGELNQLTTGRFCAHVKQGKPTQPFVFSAPKHCLGNKNYMGKEKWAKEKERNQFWYVPNHALDTVGGPVEPPIAPEGHTPHPDSENGQSGQKYSPKFKF